MLPSEAFIYLELESIITGNIMFKHGFMIPKEATYI